MNDNPVIQTIERLKQLDLELASSVENDGVLKEIVELLDRLNDSCTDKGSGNVAIATRNGGVQLVCSVLLKLPSACNQGVISSLKTLASLLHGMKLLVTMLLIGTTALLNDRSDYAGEFYLYYSRYNLS